MAESTSLESASASYSSSSTSFAAETETIVSDCEVDSGEEAEVHKVSDYVTMPIRYVHSMLNNIFFGNNRTEARE